MMRKRAMRMKMKWKRTMIGKMTRWTAGRRARRMTIRRGKKDDHQEGRGEDHQEGKEDEHQEGRDEDHQKGKEDNHQESKEDDHQEGKADDTDVQLPLPKKRKEGNQAAKKLMRAQRLKKAIEGINKGAPINVNKMLALKPAEMWIPELGLLKVDQECLSPLDG